MTNTGKLDPKDPQAPRQPISCARCEALLSEAMDSMDAKLYTALSAAQQEALQQHLAACAACRRLQAMATQGQAWLALLKNDRPEPPETLAMRILSRTSALGLPVLGLPAFSPALATATNIVPMPRPRISLLTLLRQTIFQPQLGMAAAMAFFSFSLTLNLTGVKLNQFHISDLRPSSLQHEFFQAGAQAVRYYDNLRVVNELESNMQQIQLFRSTPVAPAAAPEQNHPNQINPEQDHNPSAKPKGSSQRNLPNHTPRAEAMPEFVPLDPNPHGPDLNDLNQSERNQA